MCKGVGYNQPEHAIKRHCRGCTFHTLLTAGGNHQKKFIPEGVLYRLIIRSKLPAAVRFESFVCDVVLPSLRLHGAYTHEDIWEQMRNSSELRTSCFAGCPKSVRKTKFCNTSWMTPVKTQLGEVDIRIPRDRNREYEPPIPHFCRHFSDACRRLAGLIGLIGVPGFKL